MRALVSTMQQLLHVDLATREVVVLDNDRPEYYGITWEPGSDALILSHSGIDNATLLSLEAYATSEKGWLSFPGGKTETFLSQPHQIQWCSDGRVVATNTGRNRLVAIDPRKRGQFQEAGLSESRWDRLGIGGPYGDHLNSVFEHDGKLYAIANGHAQGSRLAIFTYPDMTLVSSDPVPGRTGLHNIFVTSQGQQLSCHSEAAALVDLTSGSMIWEAGTPIYTRGMAATDDFIFLGESAKTGRDLRRSSMSGLWMIDRKTWRTSDYFPLGPYGAVHDVRIIDEVDHAHHGTPLRNAEQFRGTTAHDTFRKHKLARSEAAQATRRQWAGYDIVLGTAETDLAGWKHSHDGLTIATRQRSAADIWEFDYAIEPDGHLSVIVDYNGSGGDSGMTAFLAQSSGAKADLTEWREAGAGWTAVRGLQSQKLPTRGRAKITCKNGRFTMSVDNALVHSCTLPPSALAHLTGIRWLKASVRPVTNG